MRASSSRLRTLARPFIAGLLHAVLMACAFPPVGWWPLAFVAILPLVWLACREGGTGSQLNSTGDPKTARPWHPAWLDPLMVSVGALPLWAYEQVWIIDVSALGYYPMVAALAAFAGIFVWAVRRMRRRWPAVPLAILVPIAWTGIEVVHGEVAFTGYPWMLLGHPLIEWIPLASPAAVLGVYFVGFLVAMVVGAIADAAFVRPARPAAAVAGVVVAAAIWTACDLFAPMGASGPGPMRVAVVQTNIPQDNKNEWKPAARLHDFARFVELTRKAANASPKPDLIVWPETMFPGIALDPWFAEHLERRAAQGAGEPEARSLTPIYAQTLALQQELGIPLLIGSTGYDRLETPGGEASLLLYNSAFLVEHGSVSPIRYDKIKLTPFGEVMPYIEYWPWLQKKLLALGANGMDFNLQKGTRPRVFTIRTAQGPVSVSTPICFEGTTPSVNRSLVRVQPEIPNLIVNLTNDGWFSWFDPGRWQHLQNARWRSVELGVPMVRAANTGVSCSIDGRGRVLKAGVDGDKATARVDGVLIADVRPAVPATIYSRIGRVFVWTALGAMILLLASTYLKGRRAVR
jgi:apolipoprotein N-acyltransferase